MANAEVFKVRKIMSAFTNAVWKVVVSVLGLGPATATVYGWWFEVKNRPLRAGGIVLACESFIGISAFIKGVWEKELRAALEKSLAAGARSPASSTFNFFRNVFAGFATVYCACRSFQMRGSYR
jgi:hypothetical protein